MTFTKSGFTVVSQELIAQHFVRVFHCEALLV